MIGRRFLLLLFVFIIYIIPIYSSEHKNDLSHITFTYNYYIDKANEFQINKSLEIPFRNSTPINFPFFKGTIFIKITLNNTSPLQQELVLFNNDIINRNYYFYTLSHTPNIQQTPCNNRSFSFSKPNYKITLHPNEQKVYYIQCKSDGRAIRATPHIVSLNHFISLMRQENIKNTFFYGVIFIILLINIFYWRFLQKKVYLYYVSYILFTLLFYLGFDGYLFNLGISDTIIEHFIFFALKCMVFALLLFSAYFLNIKNSNPNFYKHLKRYTAMIMVSVLVYQLFFCTYEVGKIHIIEFCFGFVWLFLLIYMIVIALQKNRANTRYYLLAISTALFFVLIGIINISLKTGTTGKFLFKIGTTIEFIIFTYVTAKILERNTKKLQSKLSEVHTHQLKKTDLLTIFKLLEANITCEEEWTTFKNKLQELNPNFLTNLYQNHPTLSKSEIRLLTLVKIGFTQKEIANVLYIAQESVKKAKQRVRKKIGLSKEITLSNYLATI
ncbi:7TM diverse intracellular signaling domain-containing protein [Tenacibaculum agarivorans]|uniref:7TM diverse intracellular signaling domain-containing protein n=1 Tax=Tenacibaculum agarivorans TaxID=1908389 RepID=UPI00094B9B87|nr:7TM diverse intracellular signaling domain-containing protein [Tenacibaculum agarivorans]